MQYTEIFKVVKNENFQKKMFDIFLIFAQNINCGYTLEPLQRDGSKEYLQSMFWSKNKKQQQYPCNPQFYYIKVGNKVVFISRTCFSDDRDKACISIQNICDSRFVFKLF